jgi:N4-gp56 family major capsid protein
MSAPYTPQYSATDDIGVATGFELTDAILEVYSRQLQWKAMPLMPYENFVVVKDELTNQPGNTVRFIRANDIPRGGKLSEGVAMTTKPLSQASIFITTDEWGNAVALTERLQRNSWQSVLSTAATALSRDYALVRNLSIRDAITAAGSTIFPDPGSAGLGDVATGDVLDVETVRRAATLLKDQNTPKFLNDFYVCFLSPTQAAHVRRDPDWKDAALYAGARQIFAGECGRFEDVIFVETTLAPSGAVASTDDGYEAALDGTGAGGIDLRRATFMGDEAVGLANSMQVQMRSNGVRDFARIQEMAWLAYWGVGTLNSDHIVHAITA